MLVGSSGGSSVGGVQLFMILITEPTGTDAVLLKAGSRRAARKRKHTSFTRKHKLAKDRLVACERIRIRLAFTHL